MLKSPINEMEYVTYGQKYAPYIQMVSFAIGVGLLTYSFITQDETIRSTCVLTGGGFLGLGMRDIHGSPNRNESRLEVSLNSNEQ